MSKVQQIDIDLLEPSPLRRGPLPSVRPSDLQVAERQGLGVLPPLVARRGNGGRYEILVGLRIWLMAQKLNDHSVGTVVLEGVSDEVARELIQNDVAGERNIIAVAKELKELSERARLSKAEIARRYGLSRSEVSNRIRLLGLYPEVQSLLISGEISQGQARPLLGLPRKTQIELALMIQRQRPTVREVERLAKERKAGEGAPRPITSNEKDPSLSALEKEVSELVGSPVSIDARGDRRGWRLIIDCHDLEVLDGVLERLGYHPDP